MGSICGDDFKCHDVGGPACTACLRDDFDDDVIDPAKWRVLTPNAPTTTTERDGALEIAPPAGLDGAHYSQTLSTGEWDIEDGFVEVEIVESTNPDVDGPQTRFEMQYAATGVLMIVARGDASGGLISFLVTVEGTVIADVARPRTSRDRVWRIAGVGTEVAFQTSDDRSIWTTELMTAVPFPLRNLKPAMSAGTSNRVSSPGVARYDNLRIVVDGCPGHLPVPTDTP